MDSHDYPSVIELPPEGHVPRTCEEAQSELDRLQAWYLQASSDLAKLQAQMAAVNVRGAFLRGFLARDS